VKHGEHPAQLSRLHLLSQLLVWLTHQDLHNPADVEVVVVVSVDVGVVAENPQRDKSSKALL